MAKQIINWGKFGELIERHAARKDRPDYGKYRDNPVAFIYEVLGVKELWWMQEVIASLVTKETRVVVRSGNAGGKDFLAAHLALWFIYARHGMVLADEQWLPLVYQACYQHCIQRLGEPG